MKRLYLILVLLIAFCHAINSQTHTYTSKKGDVTKVLRYNSKLKPKKINMKYISNEYEISLESNVNKSYRAKPFRFGKAIDVNIDLNDGNWEQIDSGRIWKLEIHSETAYSINLIFSELYVPSGGELNIYNTTNTMLFGPIKNENTDGKKYLTDVIAGNSIIMELYEPDYQKDKTRLSIAKVIHGYKNLYSQAFGDAVGCINDVDCSQYSAWQDVSNAVSMILLGNGQEICTGCILNKMIVG